jgi:hypothetical protein
MFLGNKRFKTLFSLFYISLLIFPHILCSNLNTRFTESSLLTTELENDLCQLLNKIQQKKIQSQNSKNSNLTQVSINNFYDLREFLTNFQNLKENIFKEKDKEKIDLENLAKKISDHVKKNQDNLNKLKDEYDKIIKQTNDVSRDINAKQSELMILRSDNELVKNEYEKFNEIFSEKVKKNFDTQDQLETKFTKNSELKLEDKISQKFLNLNQKLSELNKSLTQRNQLQEKILKTSEKSKKAEIEFKNLKKVSEENLLDKQFFKVIEGNLQSNIKNMRNEEFNSTVLITSLNRIVNDKENLKKLESEKFQLNEMSKDTYKNLKKLLTEHETVQFEINNLMKKKNKLKEEISAKEIEENLKIAKLKKEISQLKNEIKFTENKMSENLKNQKNVYYYLNLLFLVSNE